MALDQRNHDAYKYMARLLEPKCRQCRREGEKLYLKGDRCYTSKCAIVKRNYIPGVHGVKGKVRLTEFGTQLREKQKAKRTYRLLETQFRNYYEAAIKKTGNTGEIMLQMIESRLDNQVYRSGLASSRDQARQLVSHGHFLVNGKNLDIPSYLTEAGDVIAVKEQKKQETYWQGVFSGSDQGRPDVPVWLKADRKNGTISVSQVPSPEMIQSPLNMTLIVEFYSR